MKMEVFGLDKDGIGDVFVDWLAAANKVMANCGPVKPQLGVLEPLDFLGRQNYIPAYRTPPGCRR
jgi:hypothetical protein